MISDRDCNIQYLSFLQVFGLVGTKVMLPLPKADPHRVFCGRINFPLPASLVVSQIAACFSGQPISAWIFPCPGPAVLI